ncbi:MAG: sugar kinase [Myxococcota bacterium]
MYADSHAEVRHRFVCFGELLLRLTSPGNERLLQSMRLDVHVGGAEANVAVSLATFGHHASVVSAVPDNRLGQACLMALRSHQVDTSMVRTRPGRMGLYFLEEGAVTRPSRVVYDRARSSFAESGADDFDWSSLLQGVGHLHMSGITPAVGPGPAAAALRAVAAAGELGVKISFDGNYREGLWRAWRGDGPGILRQILAGAHVAFINERDTELLLGVAEASRERAMERAFEAFPSLEMVATTRSVQRSVSALTFSGELYLRNGQHQSSRTYELEQVVDRIGRGDAFAAGVLHGIAEGYEPARIIEFAAAASAIKHSIPGDWNLTSIDEVEMIASGKDFDVRR